MPWGGGGEGAKFGANRGGEVNLFGQIALKGLLRFGTNTQQGAACKGLDISRRLALSEARRAVLGAGCACTAR